jgi:hypothetical protein
LSYRSGELQWLNEARNLPPEKTRGAEILLTTSVEQIADLPRQDSTLSYRICRINEFYGPPEKKLFDNPDSSVNI